MESVLQSYGLAGLVISVLAGVVVYLVRKNDVLQSKIDALQETRLQDARDTRDKLAEPMEAQSKLSEKMYDLLLNINNQRSH